MLFQNVQRTIAVYWSNQRLTLCNRPQSRNFGDMEKICTLLKTIFHQAMDVQVKLDLSDRISADTIGNTQQA